MKKRFFVFLAAVLMAVSASAQFEKGKVWAGVSATGFDLSYSPSTKLHLGLDLTGGYFINDNVMVKGIVGVNLQGADSGANEVSLGGGARYYFKENGVFLGADLTYVHAATNYNDVVPQFEVGYAFFIGRYVTVEPALYYRQAFSDNDFSRFGVKVGIGLDLEQTLKIFGLK